MTHRFVVDDFDAVLCRLEGCAQCGSNKTFAFGFRNDKCGCANCKCEWSGAGIIRDGSVSHVKHEAAPFDRNEFSRAAAND